MAGNKSGNDTIQIILMTFYLMAIFFGCWGAWNHLYKDRKEVVKRDKERQNLARLESLLKDPKSKDTLLSYRRIQESKANQGELSEEVYGVVKTIGNLNERIENRSNRAGARQSGGMVEVKTVFEFKPMELGAGLLHFVAAVETKLPHCSFSKVQLTRKARGEDADLWAAEMHIVTYRSKNN